MNNPWNQIDINIYEKHMSSEQIYQLQMLESITRQQVADNDPEKIGILGVAGGNGLSVIDSSKTKKIFAIDINQTYLDICKKRFQDMFDFMETLCLDLSEEGVRLPHTTLLIANLIIEYIGEEQFVKVIHANKDHLKTISCVIQRNHENSFVSSSELAAHFEPLLSIHHDVEEEKLIHLFQRNGFVCKQLKKYQLPNNKEFIRMDFQLQY